MQACCRGNLGAVVEFDWDPAKAASNIRKHRLDFQSATKVFIDPNRLEIEQEDDDDGLRYNCIGIVDNRMLVVTFTMRGETVRIISARAAKPHEKRLYHEV
jgi:uncharacterized protein